MRPPPKLESGSNAGDRASPRANPPKCTNGMSRLKRGPASRALAKKLGVPFALLKPFVFLKMMKLYTSEYRRACQSAVNVADPKPADWGESQFRRP